jgi:hypothetical protein
MDFNADNEWLGINLDFDAQGTLVDIELLSPQTQLPPDVLARLR